MLTRPQVYGEESPFLLVLAADRERVVRFLAESGIAMILTTEGTSLSRVELPGCTRREALRLMEQMARRSLGEQWLGEKPEETKPSDSAGFTHTNRLRSMGLLDDE